MAVGRDVQGVIDEAKAAGVYVFGGGIDEEFRPLSCRPTAKSPRDVTRGALVDGGFIVLDLSSREEADMNRARACEGQSLRPRATRFGFDPKSEVGVAQ